MVRFRIPNMSCGGCARAVTAALRGADPNAEVRIVLRQRAVAVDGVAGAEDRARALREAGFEGQQLAP